MNILELARSEEVLPWVDWIHGNHILSSEEKEALAKLADEGNKRAEWVIKYGTENGMFGYHIEFFENLKALSEQSQK